MDESEAAEREGRASLAVLLPGGGKPAWHVSPSIDPRLTKYPRKQTRDDRARAGLITKYPVHVVDLAYRRVHWLHRWRRACNGPRAAGETTGTRAAGVVAEARRLEADDFKISVRVMMRWHRAYNQIGSDGCIVGVAGLIDRRGCKGTTDLEQTTSSRDASAIHYFYSLYRTENKLSAKLCHEATAREGKRHGWNWPESYAATTRWLTEKDCISLTYLMRHGKEKWAHKYMPYNETDYDAIGPGDVFVSDHHRCDWWVSYKGRQLRPWLTTIQDQKSRCVVGWHLGPSPHQDAIVCAMRMAFAEWAIPVAFRIDQGKDFTAKLFQGISRTQRKRLSRELGPEWRRTVARLEPGDSPLDTRWLGILNELDIQVMESIPYAPWSKAGQERFYGRLEDQHGKTYATYTGNSTANKPECVEDIKRGRIGRVTKELSLVNESIVPTMAESRKRLGEWLDIYHRTAHRSLSGAAPLAVWQTATSLRRAADDELTCLLETRGVYKVGGNGVRFKVGSASIGYGKSCAALRQYVGRSVLILLNPDDISHVWAFTAERGKRRPIARLEANRRIAPNTCADDAREAIAETMRERSVMHKSRRASARRTLTAEQRINEHSRAVRADLLKQTGTDAVDAAILPVRTGFEAGSKALRAASEPPLYEPPDLNDINDLFDATAHDESVEIDDDGSMEDLFASDNDTDVFDDEDGLESLL